MLKEFSKLYLDYKGNKGILGYSTLKIPIYYYDINLSERPIIFMHGTIHAREYITAYVLKEFLFDLEKRMKSGRVVIAPIVNPDGVKITKILPTYKANARGVDLNVNFNARWGTGKSNLTYPSTANYIGKAPNSERETQDLIAFTKWLTPDATVSFHSKGEEIYYEFFDEKLKARDKPIAEKISSATGYKIRENLSSSGGYKDFVLSTFALPSLTVEVGKDSLTHPINSRHAKAIYNKVKSIPLILIDHLNGNTPTI